MFNKATLLLLAIVSVADVQAAPGRRATKVPVGCVPINANTLPGLKNPGTCIMKVATQDIDNPTTGVYVSSINNWAGGRIPPPLRGVFYLSGDPFAAEVLSFGGAYWNDTTQTFDIPTFSPRTWTSDIGSGQPKHNLEEGTVFKNKCTKNAKTGLLRCLSQEYHFNGDKAVTRWGDYTCDQTDATGDHYNRASNLGIIPILGNPIPGSGSEEAPIRYTYQMWKIVDDQGRRTARFQKNYLADKGNLGISFSTGQLLPHLGDYQEVIH